MLTSSFDEIERVVDIDFWGVVNGTKAFLPHLIASGDGHVVNISSLFGLLSVPSQSAYNAAKFAVRGFTESLRQEMLVAGTRCASPASTPAASRPISPATPPAPPPTPTARRWSASSAIALRMAPSDAARVILTGVARNRPRVLVGADAKALDLLVRLTGSGYQQVVARVARRTLS